MSIPEIIRSRRSVRSFSGAALCQEDAEKIMAFAAGASNPYGIPVSWFLLDAKKDGLSSPVISDTNIWIAGKMDRVSHAEEAFGFSFEKIVLFAESLGVGTTIIAGTMNRPAFEKAVSLAEGEVLPCVSPLGYPAKKRRGFLYASADIYFSSITPSATGGQPASAYFMYKDGVSAIEVTVSLILNLTMYTLALVTLGFFTLIFFPGIFLEFNTASKVMILIGILVMILLAIFFIILLKKQSLVLKIGNIIISILHKLHIKNLAERFKTKLDTAIENYNECVITLAGKKKLLVKTYLLNLLQRASQILVTMFCYFAMHGNLTDGLRVFAIQTYIVLGSNFIPVPGAVGISEFMMFFGYMMLMNEEAACSLAILSRGISFYTCGIISIFTVILGYLMIFYKHRKEVKK